MVLAANRDPLRWTPDGTKRRLADCPPTQRWGFIMKAFLAGIALGAVALVLPGFAEAKGCIKGALVGGVVGHYAGHHGVVGAAAGCLIERHREKKQARQLQQNPNATR